MHVHLPRHSSSSSAAGQGVRLGLLSCSTSGSSAPHGLAGSPIDFLVSCSKCRSHAGHGDVRALEAVLRQPGRGRRLPHVLHGRRRRWCAGAGCGRMLSVVCLWSVNGLKAADALSALKSGALLHSG